MREVGGTRVASVCLARVGPVQRLEHTEIRSCLTTGRLQWTVSGSGLSHIGYSAPSALRAAWAGSSPQGPPTEVVCSPQHAIKCDQGVYVLWCGTHWEGPP